MSLKSIYIFEVLKHLTKFEKGLFRRKYDLNHKMKNALQLKYIYLLTPLHEQGVTQGHVF